MSQNEVIVVGGDHYNTLWVIRSLGLKNVYSYAIIYDEHKKHSFVTKCKYLKNSWVVNSKEELLSLLNNVLHLEQKAVIISSNDFCSDILDQNYTDLSKSFILPNCEQKQGALSSWMDKEKMNAAAKEAGFNIPGTWKLTLEKGVTPNPKEMPVYPCIIKPVKSSKGEKADFRICHDYDILIEELTSLSFHLEEVLIQEFLKPDFEISILGVILPNCHKNIIPGLLYKTGTCSSVNNLGMPTYAYVDPNLEPYIDREAVSRFFSKVDYSGLYSIEFFVSNGKAYFLEVNLRVDGDLFVYTQGGVNMPYLWLLDATDTGISEEQLIVEKKTYGMTEISYIKYINSRNPIKVMKDLFRADCFSIFSSKDIKPFVYKFIYALKH